MPLQPGHSHDSSLQEYSRHTSVNRIDSYTGNGGGERSFSGFGFTPEAVFFLRRFNGDNCYYNYFKHKDLGEWDIAETHGIGAIVTNAIRLDSDGFTVNNGGANALLNSNLDNYYYIAWGKTYGSL